MVVFGQTRLQKLMTQAVCIQVVNKARSLEQHKQMIKCGNTISGRHVAYCVAQNALSQLCVLCSG